MLRPDEKLHGQKMGAAENSALDLPPAQLPSGVTAKMLLSTAPYNAQNPQTNQVSATRNWKLSATRSWCPFAHGRDVLRRQQRLMAAWSLAD